MKPLAAGLALALICGPVLAAETLANPPKYLGAWTFSGDTEGTSSCTVQLKAPAVIGGYVITAPKPAPRSSPARPTSMPGVRLPAGRSPSPTPPAAPC